MVTWQGWACWERHLACALFLLASRSRELVPLHFYKSRVCEPPRRRGPVEAVGYFLTRLGFVLFYFISRSLPRLRPPFTLLILFCLPSLEIWNPPNPDADVEKHAAFRGRAEMWGGMASTPLTHSPAGTEILLWFRLWPTRREWATKRFVKCVLTPPPRPVHTSF